MKIFYYLFWASFFVIFLSISTETRGNVRARVYNPASTANDLAPNQLNNDVNKKNNITTAPIPPDHHHITMTYGRSDAPVVFRVFTAYSCPHCSIFHREQLPQLIKDYVNQGKLFIVIEPFAMDGQTLRAILATFALPKNKRKQAASRLFESQDKWLFEVDLAKFHTAIGHQLNMTTPQVDAAVANEPYGKAIVERRVFFEELYQIDGAPVFMIERTQGSPQESVKIDGFHPYPQVKKQIDAFLQALPKAAQTR